MQPARSFQTRRTRSGARRRLTAAVVCLLVCASAAAALEPTAETAALGASDADGAADRWQLVEAMAEGFRALLPRDDTWQEQSFRETVIGTVSETKYFARGDDGRVFSIGLHTLPKLGKLFAPSSLILSNAKKNVLLTDAGREISYERRSIGDHPGALLTYAPTRVGDDYGVMEAHLVLVGRRLYVLKASHTGGASVQGETDLFFESFEVIE